MYIVICLHRSGFNGVSPQLVANSLAGTLPMTQQQQQAYIAQLQAAGFAAAAASSYASAMASGMPPGMLYNQPLSSGEGTGSECSSAPSSPRESSDENDRGMYSWGCLLSSIASEMVSAAMLYSLQHGFHLFLCFIAFLASYELQGTL